VDFFSRLVRKPAIIRNPLSKGEKDMSTRKRYSNALLGMGMVVFFIMMTGTSGANTLKLGTLKGKKGETVTYTLSVDSAPNEVNALGFEVQYDATVLRYKGFKPGSLTQKYTQFGANNTDFGTVRIGGFEVGDNKIPKGASGDLVQLEFEVIEEKGSQLKVVNTLDDIKTWSSEEGSFSGTAGSDTGNNIDGGNVTSDAPVAQTGGQAVSQSNTGKDTKTSGGVVEISPSGSGKGSPVAVVPASDKSGRKDTGTAVETQAVENQSVNTGTGEKVSSLSGKNNESGGKNPPVMTGSSSKKPGMESDAAKESPKPSPVPVQIEHKSNPAEKQVVTHSEKDDEGIKVSGGLIVGILLLILAVQVWMLWELIVLKRLIKENMKVSITNKKGGLSGN
jgi:hypothetical protein